MVDVHEKRLRGNETTQNESTNNEEALGTDSIHSIDSSSEIKHERIVWFQIPDIQR